MAEPEPPKRNPLFRLAAEGMVPVIGGCAGALAGGPEGGLAGVAVGKAVEKAVNLFGRGIVERWEAWFRKNREEAAAAVAQLAALPPAEARKEAKSLLLDLAPDADAKDISLALEFLTAIPCAVDRALVPDAAGGRSLPPTISFDDPRALLRLLPEDVPPYPSASELPGTPYRLVELLGTGGFGAVYRAVSPTLQHLPLAIKFCLDRSLLPALNQERSNLERLMRAGGRGSEHVVRLYGYDLDHPTPYLVYEFVPDGDLTRLVAARAVEGKSPDAAEVLGWMVQITEGLAFAHRAGLVHRDLKPANVLADGSTLKLADFGLGGVAAARAALRSRIGTTTLDYLSLADQASLFRGAGTPLYMSPEQRRGAAPDPRHDLYALGVVWFQLLVGDVSRELHHGWAKELAVRYGVPADHIALIERCVGWFDERPKDANELLPLLLEAAGKPVEPNPARGTVELPPVGPSSSRTATVTNASQPTPVPEAPVGHRLALLESMVGRLEGAFRDLERADRSTPRRTAWWAFLVGLLAGWLVLEVVYAQRYPRRDYRLAVFDGLDGVASVAGLLTALLAGAIYFRYARAVIRGMREGHAENVGTLARELAAEFPAQVAAWGGPAVLRDPETVRRIRADLAPRPASATSSLGHDEIAADPVRRAVLAGRLKDQLRLMRDTNNNLDSSWVGLAGLWLAAVPTVVGVTLTVLLGPGGVAARWPSDYREPAITLIVVPLGVGTAWLSWWAMAAVRRHYRRRWEEAIDRFAADYARLVEAWGGRETLRSGELVEALLRSVDPSAAAPAGWFRRLFGG